VYTGCYEKAFFRRDVGEGIEFGAATDAEGGSTMEEEGDVRAELGAERGEGFERERFAGEGWEGEEDRGCVGGSPAESGSHWDFLC
jgi:hypothetical protein